MFSSPKKIISVFVLLTFFISNSVFAFGFLIPLATNLVRSAVIASSTAGKAYKVGSKIFIPLAERQAAKNKRGLQILVAGLGLTFGATLAQLMGFTDSASSTTTGCISYNPMINNNFITNVSAPTFAAAESATTLWLADINQFVSGSSVYFITTGAFVGSYQGILCSATGTIVTPSVPAIDSLASALSDPTAPQSLTDDLLFAVKQSISHSGFDSAVSIQDVANYQLPSDYFGDSLAVDHLGDILLNGVPLTGNVGTYTGLDGVTHHMTINSNGDLLVDGQLSTGFTASNLSTGSSTATSTTANGVTTTNTTTIVDNTAVITGLRAVQSSIDSASESNTSALSVNTAADSETRPMTLTGLTTAAQTVVDTSPLNSWAGALNVTGGSPSLPSYDLDLLDLGFFTIDFNTYTWFFDVLSIVILIAAAGFAVSIVFRR